MAVREQVPDEIQARMQDADGAGAMAAHRIDWTDPQAIPDDQLISFVTHQYRVGKARRYDWEREAAVQTAWTKGQQHLIWSEAKRMLIDSGDNADLPLEQREPVMINKLRGFVLAFLGMLLGGPITFQSYPQTNENDDVANSRTLSRLIGHFFGASHLQGQTKLLKAFWQMFCTGIVFARVTYDPFAGGEDWYSAGMMKRPGEDPNDPAIKAGWKEQLKRFVAGKRKVDPSKIKLNKDGAINLPQGEIDVKWVTGFDVTEPDHCKDIPSAPWIMVSNFQTIESMKQRYGAKAGDIVAADLQAYRTHNRYDADLGRRNSDVQNASSEAEDVLVHELWRPRIYGVCPEGFLGIVANNTVFKKTVNPYVHGRIPLVAFTELPDSDSFRPACAVRDLMSLQRNKNQTRSLLNGYLRATIDPRILHEPSAGLPEDLMSKWPKLVPIREGGIDKVKFLEPPSAPAFMGELDQMDTRDMEDVANVHRSSMGQTEGASQSGRHAEAMKSGDRLVHRTTRTLVQEAGSEVGAQIAALIWQFYDEKRTVQILGENQTYQAMTFKGRDLMSKPPIGPQAANVRCILANVKEPEDTLNMIKGLTEMGLMDPTNEAHRAIMMRWINQEVPPDTDDEAEHRYNAARENEQLLGPPMDRSQVRAAYGDDDAVHIREHEKLTTTARYRQAVEKDKSIGMAHWVHMQEHMFGHWLKQMQPQAMQGWVQAYLQQIGPPMNGPPPGAPGTAGPGGAPAGAGSPGGAPPTPPPGSKPPPAGAPPGPPMTMPNMRPGMNPGVNGQPRPAMAGGPR